jgi:uncharacterized protein involved in exopolysaccharide biosynthesis
MIRTEDYKRELYFIFFAQSRIIWGTTILFLILAILIAFLWPPTFSATGSILVRGKKPEKSPEALEQTQIRFFPLTKEDLFSEVQILTSPDVIKRTIKYLKKNNLYHSKKKGKVKYSIDKEVYEIKESLKSEVIPASNVINVTFYDKDPKDAVTILDALMDQYLIYRMEVYTPKQAQLFFSQQADNYKKILGKKENSLKNTIENAQVSDPLKEIENNLVLKKDLEEELNSLRTESIEKELFIRHLQKTINKKDIQFFSFIDNKPINDLSIKLQELIIERGRILRTYHPLSDRVKAIDKQIKNTYASLKSEVLAYKENQLNQLNIINQKIMSIEDRLESINRRNIELQKLLIDLQRMKRETNLLEFSYETFSKRRDEAKMSSAGNMANFPLHISILSKAFPSEGPIFPKKKVVIPIGILVGFITGCSLGFMREYFDHTFKKPSDVYDYTGLPVIFSVPNFEKHD